MIVPGGACSFSASAKRYGANVVAIDPLYANSKSNLAKLGNDGIKKIYANTDWMANHNMSFYGDLDAHKAIRNKALSEFLQDFNSTEYLCEKLPSLSFANAVFDLCLSAHFLFTYDDRFSYDFHLASVLEMARVAKEVRLFPLVDMNNSRQNSDKPFSLFVYRLLLDLPKFGLCANIEPVGFEFQRGGGFMMRVMR